MLQLEAIETSYKKSDFNSELRSGLKGRTKGSVELKFQNISAVLNNIGLPFIDGYKPRGNLQLLLRKAVQKMRNGLKECSGGDGRRTWRGESAQ